MAAFGLLLRPWALGATRKAKSSRESIVTRLDTQIGTCNRIGYIAPVPPSPPRTIAVTVATGFFSVASVALSMCLFLVWIIYDVSTLVSGMQHDEMSIRQGLELSTSVREQAIHAGHYLISPDEEHLERYRQRRERTRMLLQSLASHVPEAERWQLVALAETTEHLHQVFAEGAAPAARQKNRDELLEIHAELEALEQRAGEHADALVRALEGEMAHAHDLATDSTRIGMLGGGVFLLLIFGLSVHFTRKLRAELLRPLVTLTEAADRFGRGEFHGKLGAVGQGELAALGQAFDQMSAELSRRQAQLVENERMAAIGQLAAGVAHELNNPIGIIRGYLKTMSPEDSKESLKEELAILDEEASHCQRIAEDLLSYSRKGELHRERFDVKELVEQTVARLVETSSSAKEIRVELDSARVHADRSRMRQVVMNLLLNALQVSEQVHVRGALEGTDYIIRVSDRGPGIPEEERRRVFEPFHSTRKGGSGLGLSVALGIVQAHGGSIRVESAEGGGAEFVVLFPIDSPAASARGAS